MALPVNVRYGTVVGQFIASVGDTESDIDALPDSKPMGGSIVFTPSVPYVKNVSNPDNPITIVKTSITAILDEEGYICTPTIDPVTLKYIRGIKLVATDDPNLNPVNWTWNVDYRLTDSGKQVAGPARHPISVAMDATVDLTLAAPVASSPGNAIVRGPSGIITIEHGTDGTIARPETDGIVYWVGTAQPLNAAPLDWWYSV